HQAKVAVGFSALAHYRRPQIQRTTSTTRRLYEQWRHHHKGQKLALHAISAFAGHHPPAISRVFPWRLPPKNIFSPQTAEVGLGSRAKALRPIGRSLHTNGTQRFTPNVNADKAL